MVKKIVAQNPRKIKKAVPTIEQKTNVSINVTKKGFQIKGKEYNEFVADKIMQAIDFGFDIEASLLLLDENYVIEYIDIKNHTPRKNLKDVRARIIGRSGKVLDNIENLTGAELVVHDNKVGLIIEADNLDITIQAITSLIRGSKHSNIFSYLEKNKKGRFMRLNEDLGLKEKAKKIDEE